MKTLQELAGEAYAGFVRGTRDDGSEYWHRKDDAADDWLQELCYSAHGDMLPDDWKYEFIAQSLSALADHEDEDSARDRATEADIYTGERLRWLASNLTRAGYCDDAAEEWGAQSDIVQFIGLGQAAEKTEVFYSVLRSLRDRLEEIELEEPAEDEGE